MEFEKRLNVAGSYLRVTGVSNPSMPEAQGILRAATGLTFPEDHISLDPSGFMCALPLDIVGHLLNECFVRLGDKDSCPRVKFRDPNRLKDWKVGKNTEFVPPPEWLK